MTQELWAENIIKIGKLYFSKFHKYSKMYAHNFVMLKKFKFDTFFCFRI